VRSKNNKKPTGLSRVPGTLKAVHADNIHANLFRRQRVADRHALVNANASGLFEHGHPLLGVVACRLDNLDVHVNDHLRKRLVIRRDERREDGQVNTERLLGPPARLLDALFEILRRAKVQRGEHAEPAGLGDGHAKVDVAGAGHAAADDWVFDLEHFGDASAEWAHGGR